MQKPLSPLRPAHVHLPSWAFQATDQGGRRRESPSGQHPLVAAAGTAAWGRSRGLEAASGTDACATLQAAPSRPSGLADELLRDGADGQSGLCLPVKRAASPGRGGRAGRSRAGGGRAGSGAHLPLREEQVAAVRAGPGLPVRACQLPSLLGAPGASPAAAWPGPMAQTPDGISCELRGKRGPCFTHLFGEEAAVRAPEPSRPRALRVPGKRCFSWLLQRACCPETHSSPSLLPHR